MNKQYKRNSEWTNERTTFSKIRTMVDWLEKILYIHGVHQQQQRQIFYSFYSLAIAFEFSRHVDDVHNFFFFFFTHSVCFKLFSFACSFLISALISFVFHRQMCFYTKFMRWNKTDDFLLVFFFVKKWPQKTKYLRNVYVYGWLCVCVYSIYITITNTSTIAIYMCSREKRWMNRE